MKQLRENVLAAARVWAKSLLTPVTGMDPVLDLLHAINTLAEREALDANSKRAE